MTFTIFNACTVFVMLAALALGFVRFRFPRPDFRLALVAYAVLLGYTFGFKYSLDPRVMLAGAALAGVMTRYPKLRWADLPILAYALWRGTELLLGL